MTAGEIERRKEVFPERPHEETHGFPIAADEEIVRLIHPDSQDFWGNTIAIGLILWIPMLVSTVWELVSVGSVVLQPFITWSILSVLAGLLAGVIGSAPPNARLAVTDRGLHARVKGAMHFIPWRDVVAIEPVFPWAGPWRVEFREGAPVLDRIPENRAWTGVFPNYDRDRTRVLGASYYDFGNVKLEAMQDALDRWAVENFAAEQGQDTE